MLAIGLVVGQNHFPEYFMVPLKILANMVRCPTCDILLIEATLGYTNTCQYRIEKVLRLFLTIDCQFATSH